VKSRQLSLTVLVEQLQTELVNAVFDAVRESAVAALDNVLTPSGRLFDFAESDFARVRTALRPRAARSAPRRSATAGVQLSLPLRDSSPPPAHDTPFAITDPSVLLAEVAQAMPAVQRLPLRRPRKRRASTTLHEPAQAPEEQAATTTPALRDGEQVARAVLGGGVVLRRRRT